MNDENEKTLKEKVEERVEEMIEYDVFEKTITNIAAKIEEIIESPQFAKKLKAKVLEYYFDTDGIEYVISHSDIDEIIKKMVVKYVKNGIVFKKHAEE